jgi:hypothetical protein
VYSIVEEKKMIPPPLLHFKPTNSRALPLCPFINGANSPTSF